MVRTYALELKNIAADIEEEKGTFEGFASVYGVVDAYHEVVERGAFTKTLAASGGELPLLWRHEDPVGTVKLSDSPKGLFARGRLSLGVQTGRDAFTLLRDKVVRGLSIGFNTIKAKELDGVRYLTEIKLWEVSLVATPANSEALVSGVKSVQDQQRIIMALGDFKTGILGALERK